MSRRLVRWLPLLLAALAALVAADDALARVGGGQNFGGGGGGGGGFSGGGGGGDGLGLILYFLIRLCFEYPAVGVPLLLAFVGFLGVRAWVEKSQRPHTIHRTHQRAPVTTPRRGQGIPGLAQLEGQDPTFSLPVLQEYLELVHRRALEAGASGGWDALAPFVGPGARQDVEANLRGVQRVSEVVHGGLRLERIEHRGPRTLVVALFLGSRLEQREGHEQRVYFEERWRFQRDADAESLPPEETLRMGCPSCGAAIDTDKMGRCTQCGTPITKGQLQWQAAGMNLLVRRPFQPPEVSRWSGGDEPSVHEPTVMDPKLPVAWRAFTARHPDFEPSAFKDRVRGVFLELQRAWSDGEWARARPYCTDPMYQNLRFYMEQYAEGDLRNRLDDISFDKQQVVKVQQDAWYEAITVRIWASMKDWVEDADGNVVGGNARVQRRFSEYWTFLRAAGSGASAHDTRHCPSCGAPLDDVSAAGVCGYCQTKITTGRFDWVLSRIDQPQAYQG